MAAFLVLLLCLPLQDDAARVADLLQRFDSPEPAVREEAAVEMKKLAVARGKFFLDELRRALPEVGVEAKTRIDALLTAVAKVENAHRRLAVFDPVEIPSVAGKTLVALNTGIHWINRDDVVFRYEHGWLLEKRGKIVTLLSLDFTVEEVKLEYELPADWERRRANHPKDKPAPGETMEMPFADSLRECRDHPSDVFRTAGFARWCLQRGLEEDAVKLLETIDRKAADEGYAKGGKKRPATGDELIGIAIADFLHLRAIEEANQGAPREALVKRWKHVATLPGEWKDLAGEMAGQYEKMVQEDRARVEPTAEQLAKMTRAEQSAHWIHRLRDASARPRYQLGPPSVFDSRNPEKKETAAHELLKLGWDAIPALIEHLEDQRPTRCLGYWRDFAPDSYYLVRYATACRQIFEEITGFDIQSRGHATKEEADAIAKKAAQDWWKENGAPGAERWFVKLFERAPRGFAAKKLLEIDAPRHLPAIVKRIADATNPSRIDLFASVQDHLGKAHEPVMLALLDAPTLYEVFLVVKALEAKCANPAGRPVMRARLLELDERKAYAQSHAVDLALDFLVEHPDVETAELVVTLLQRPSGPMLKSVIDRARRCIDARTAAALVPLLDNDAPTGWSTGFKTRYCDAAAQSFIAMTGYPEAYPLSIEPEPRDACIEKLKEWWVKNGASIDWAARKTRK